jgi:2-methylcitrate dehydratase PrpD
VVGTACGKGFEGPPEPIAGAQGFINAMAEPPNWSSVTDGLGESWEIAQNSIKPYPCGFVIHPFLDCVLDWRRAHPTAAVARVALRGNPLLAAAPTGPTFRPAGKARHVQHAVAAAS